MRLLFVLLFLINGCEKMNNGNWADYNRTIAEASMHTFTTEYMELVNNHRKEIGLAPLIYDEALAMIAQVHSQDMASGAVDFGHSGFELRCLEVGSVFGGETICSENLAEGQRTPYAVYAAWMNSEGDRANIEKSQSTHTGLSYKLADTGSLYWTQIFIDLE